MDFLYILLGIAGLMFVLVLPDIYKAIFTEERIGCRF